MFLSAVLYATNAKNDQKVDNATIFYIDSPYDLGFTRRLQQVAV